MQDKYNRSIRFAKLSVPLNIAMAVGKIFLGIFSFSFFLCINAFYNIGIASAKFYAVKSHEDTINTQSEDIQKKQQAAYHVIGSIVLVTSLVYIVYCIKMFSGGVSPKYHEYIAIAIAAVTFTEIAVSFQGVISARRSNEPVIEAIKLTNFVSSLISIVLTQTAIMSFTYDGDASFSNGLSGIVFGALAALIGLYMIVRNPERKSRILDIPRNVWRKLKHELLNRIKKKG